MKTVILIRHAKAEPQEPEQADIDRPLAERGRTDSRALGKWLREAGHLPEVALVSPALRTRETWEELGLEDEIPVRFPPDLYDAAPSTYLRLIGAQEDDVESLLMLGHNPALGDVLTHLLRGTEIPADLAAQPTGLLAVIGFDGDSWETAVRAPGRLVAWTVPRLLRG